MRVCKTLILVCIAFLSGVICCYAQQGADSVQTYSSIGKVVDLFNNAIGEQNRLYNGPEYDGYDDIIKGNAYFNDNKEFVVGDVVYDGYRFKGAHLLYDMNKDMLVVLSANNISKIELIKARLLTFDMAGHHFVNIDADTLSKSANLSSGIYDELYGGNSQVLVKRRKNLQNSGNLSGTIDTYFNAVKDIYIRHNGGYTTVSSQGSVLDVFKDKKKEVRQYIKSGNIDFKRNQEQAIVMVAAYYDRLTK